ncbi:hypothetical protein PFHG_02014, partial [Plasmodium falciparum HB3]
CVHIYIYIFFFFFLTSYYNMYISIYIFFFFSLWLVHFVSDNTTEYDNNVQMCKKCNLLKIKRSHHCSVCDKCIMKMDHPCMFIYPKKRKKRK